MTDKEIIIDGKACRYRTWDKDCALTGDNHGDNMKPCEFIDEKNCYYKQLKRKEQECEELNKNLIIGFKKFCDKDDKLQKYKQILDKVEQYCKEQNLKYDTTACEILDIIDVKEIK